MNIFHNAKITLALCTPMPFVKGSTGQLIHETISPLWHRSRMGLAIPTNINMIELFVDGLEVGDARSRIAAQCLAHNPQPEFLFFIDYDVLLPYDSLTKLFYRARCYPDHDIFAGVYCSKWMNPPEPLIYGENGTGAIWDWAVGDILTTESHGVKSVHMGLTLIRTSLFKKLIDADFVSGDGTVQDNKPFFLSINDQHQNSEGVKLLRRGTEDIYFCTMASKMGAKILVDTGVLAGHHDKSSGVTYGLPTNGGPVQRAKWLFNNDQQHQDRVDADAQQYVGPCECIQNTTLEELPVGFIRLDPNTICVSNCEDCNGTGKVDRPYKLAIDLGAGGERRQWPGYISYTTDIRKDSGPDYVQDTRELTLPLDHYDLVASSHHLEHIGRWDQEQVWSQIFKICKPGGKIEMIVPSIQWAAAKIMNHETDEHVMNVLYGAQEAHSYERQFNTHYFGYTPGIAVSLATTAGFVDVKTQDWEQTPSLGYNMLITGRKPKIDSVISESATLDKNVQDAIEFPAT